MVICLLVEWISNEAFFCPFIYFFFSQPNSVFLSKKKRRINGQEFSENHIFHISFSSLLLSLCLSHSSFPQKFQFYFHSFLRYVHSAECENVFNFKFKSKWKKNSNKCKKKRKNSEKRIKMLNRKMKRRRMEMMRYILVPFFWYILFTLFFLFFLCGVFQFK